MESLFDENGFTIRLWTTVTTDMLQSAMEDNGIKTSKTSNDCRIQVMRYDSVNGMNGNQTYSMFQSRALLTIVSGTNEMDFLDEIQKFITFGKEHGILEFLIDGETYPYEGSPLMYLENVLDVFVF